MNGRCVVVVLRALVVNEKHMLALVMKVIVYYLWRILVRAL